jgi:hypothetical protein
MLDRPIRDMTAAELIALRERIAEELVSRDLCEHGVVTGDWCPACNAEYKAARIDPENELEPENEVERNENRTTQNAVL